MKKSHVFLCYSRQDQDRVSQLYNRIAGEKLQPWMDTRDLVAGEDWHRVILNAIRETPVFVACLSRHSINQRGVLQEEIREALATWRQKLDSDIYLIPVRLEECHIPEALSQFQWVDVFASDGIDRLIAAIKTALRRQGVAPPAQLRTSPRPKLTLDEVLQMLQERDFFHKEWNREGRGLQHEYELLTRNGDAVIIDHQTDLVWQQSGSDGIEATIVSFRRACNFRMGG